MDPPPDLVGLPFEPTNLSGDGTTVIGHTDLPSNLGPSVWTWSNGTQHPFAGSPELNTGSITVTGISGDGRFVAGTYNDFDDMLAMPLQMGGLFDRNSSTYTILDGGMIGPYSSALDVSDSGFSVVGHAGADTFGGSRLAVWWQNANTAMPTITTLGGLPDYTTSRAVAIDGAGTRAVGTVDKGFAMVAPDEIFSEAVYWDLTAQAPTAVSLGVLPDRREHFATDISRNGMYIVGTAEGSLDPMTRSSDTPFIYSDATGIQAIPLPGGGGAFGVSNNGRVVGVEFPMVEQGQKGLSQGFIHDAQNGTRSIAEWLQQSGVAVDGWTFADARAISEDGTVVVGRLGTSKAVVPPGDDAPPVPVEMVQEGYIAKEGVGAVNPAQIQQSVTEAQVPSNVGFNLLNLSLHGAHHIPLQMMGAHRHAWVTGDFARYDRFDANSGLAEVGGALDFMDQQLVVGLGVGQSWVTQDLALGGGLNMTGQYLLTEASFRATDSPLIFTLTGAVGSWNSDIHRNYISAGAVVRSSGRPDVTSSTLRFRIDWVDAVTVAGFGFTPKIEYTVNRTVADGYTESGGPFPATFNEQGHTAEEIRIGLMAARPVLADKAILRFRAEGVHRFDETGATVSGAIPGIAFNFNVPGQQVQQDWLHLGMDFSCALSDKVTLNTSVSTATSGQDPVFGASVGIQVKF